MGLVPAVGTTVARAPPATAPDGGAPRQHKGRAHPTGPRAGTAGKGPTAVVQAQLNVEMGHGTPGAMPMMSPINKPRGSGRQFSVGSASNTSYKSNVPRMGGGFSAASANPRVAREAYEARAAAADDVAPAPGLRPGEAAVAVYAAAEVLAEEELKARVRAKGTVAHDPGRVGPVPIGVPDDMIPKPGFGKAARTQTAGHRVAGTASGGAEAREARRVVTAAAAQATSVPARVVRAHATALGKPAQAPAEDILPGAARIVQSARPGKREAPKVSQPNGSSTSGTHSTSNGPGRPSAGTSERPSHRARTRTNSDERKRHGEPTQSGSGSPRASSRRGERRGSDHELEAPIGW